MLIQVIKSASTVSSFRLFMGEMNEIINLQNEGSNKTAPPASQLRGRTLKLGQHLLSTNLAIIF